MIPDVRRTLQIGRPVSGRELELALQYTAHGLNVKWGYDLEPFCELVSDIDEIRRHTLGLTTKIGNDYGYRVIIGYGDQLSQVEIQLNQLYDHVGVRTQLHEANRRVVFFPEGKHECIIGDLNQVRGQLGEILTFRSPDWDKRIPR